MVISAVLVCATNNACGNIAWVCQLWLGSLVQCCDGNFITSLQYTVAMWYGTGRVIVRSQV